MLLKVCYIVILPVVASLPNSIIAKFELQTISDRFCNESKQPEMELLLSFPL